MNRLWNVSIVKCGIFSKLRLNTCKQTVERRIPLKAPINRVFKGKSMKLPWFVHVQKSVMGWPRRCLERKWWVGTRMEGWEMKGKLGRGTEAEKRREETRNTPTDIIYFIAVTRLFISTFTIFRWQVVVMYIAYPFSAYGRVFKYASWSERNSPRKTSSMSPYRATENGVLYFSFDRCLQDEIKRRFEWLIINYCC